MDEIRNNEIPRYRKEILRLLRALWKQQDFRMWQQIYTVIHCFCNVKGVEKHDGRRWERNCPGMQEKHHERLKGCG